MPLFFISLLDSGGYLADEVGHELPNVEAARRAGLAAAGRMIAEELALGREQLKLSVFIDDHSGERLMILPLALSRAD